MKILITGSSGFIGFHLAQRLLNKNINVVGLDNRNDYYDPTLKESRESILLNYKNFTNYRFGIEQQEDLKRVFETHEFDAVVNLAAQAGVRYSITNPFAYVDSNIVGFLNILECCRHFKINHLVYASSSSVYGANTKLPFSEKDNVDHPLSLYAASKKSNELFAHSYSSLYSIPTTGLRFFTVYGPWGRPDMALFKFTKSILEGSVLDVYNHGNHKRDFTYIEDILDGIEGVIHNPPLKNNNISQWSPATSSAPWRVFNIGSSNPINLMEYIHAIEKNLNLKAKINYMPMQPGDVESTFADTSELNRLTGYSPKFDVDAGIKLFIEWYLDYYKKAKN
ncbi:NAD-dependent epimerase [Gammaproteobacteria bacterium]|nr:NAD-dependent epimerase [Gammaproteobacteria bacterium]